MKEWIGETNTTKQLLLFSFFSPYFFYLEIITLNSLYFFSIICISTNMIPHEFPETSGACARWGSFHYVWDVENFKTEFFQCYVLPVLIWFLKCWVLYRGLIWHLEKKEKNESSLKLEMQNEDTVMLSTSRWNGKTVLHKIVKEGRSFQRNWIHDMTLPLRTGSPNECLCQILFWRYHFDLLVSKWVLGLELGRSFSFKLYSWIFQRQQD